jgi:hypothetical protein
MSNDVCLDLLEANDQLIHAIHNNAKFIEYWETGKSGKKKLQYYREAIEMLVKVHKQIQNHACCINSRIFAKNR